MIHARFGPVAQLVEHRLCKAGVWGSNPHWSTILRSDCVGATDGRPSMIDIAYLRMLRCVLAAFFVCAAFIPTVVFAAHGESAPISVRQMDGTTTTFNLWAKDLIGGWSVATGDLGTDGVKEIVLGNGLGREPRVTVYRQDGTEIGSFLVYASTMGSGVNVNVCDLTGDGLNEIITSPQRGGGPHIRVFDRFGKALDGGGMFAYAESFRGGVNLACGNLDEQIGDELVTLPAAGGGPHVRIWKWNDNNLSMKNEWFAFSKETNNGLIGVVHDQKLSLTTQRPLVQPVIRTYVIHSLPTLTKESLYKIYSRGVTSLVLVDDHLRLATESPSGWLDLENNSWTSVQSLHDSITGTSTVTVPTRPNFSDSTEEEKIVIDLSKQRLMAYEFGILTNSFHISSAKKPWITPVGIHQITAKKPLVHYAWFYGSGSAQNYDLGWVPFNLQFAPHLFVHYAPWHNNFGHPMSHGCVNVALDTMKWLYEWADEKIPVEIVE